MLINDLKYAIRLLLKKPGFTVLTTLVMATGIGLSVFLFSMENTMLFKPLPFKDGDSLVIISGSVNGKKSNRELSLHDYYEIRTNLKGISEFGAYRDFSVNISGRDGARRYNAISAEANLFQITRTKPELGRVFNNNDSLKGAKDVVVIGHDLWQNQFALSPQVLNETIRIDDVSHQIIGVMPKGYVFPNTADIWLPMREDASTLARGTAGRYHGIGHLNSDVSMQQVNNQMALIMQRLKEKYPKTNSDLGAYAHTLQLSGVGNSISKVYTMYVIALLILFLASINVGNLLLSRAIERKKETAIRVALGAPRSRLISQMLWESIIICSVGGLIGLLAATGGLEATQSITSTFFFDNPRFWWQFGIDAFTIKIFIFIVLTTILLTGLLPAWKNSGADFNSVLRDGTRGALGKKSGQLNKMLVIVEIFLCLTVLIAVSVNIYGVYMATQADYGADPTNILTAKVQLSKTTYDSPEKQVQFANALQSRLEANNNISSVIISSALPGDYTRTRLIALEGREYTENKGYPRANYIAVQSGSLEKLSVKLLEGRYFQSLDDQLEKKSAIITDSFATLHFKGQSAIGKRIRVVEENTGEPKWITVVGVVKHTIQGSPTGSSGRVPTIFRPFAQAPNRYISLGLKMKSGSAQVTQTLRQVLAAINPEVPAYQVEPYPKKMVRAVAHKIWIGSIYLVFGLAAIVLAASGIYGVMSNTIIQRTQEIGVKRALGAIEQRITREFLMMGLKQLLWGGIPGLVAGIWLAFVITRGYAFENLSLIIIACLIMAIISVVVLLAAYIPTQKALKMEPSEALHYE